MAGRDDLIERFLQAIERELTSLERPHEVETLFFGGGTPTQLPTPALRRLIELCRTWLPLVEGGEFSVEANPADVDGELATLLADEGVTRVSLGAQSLNEQKLRTLERDHSPDSVRRAVEALRRHPFSISLDLIFASPGETLDAWQHDLQEALELSPDHVSTYGLTYERGSQFWNRLQRAQLVQTAEETERQMYAAAIDTLAAHGFEHYEVSNFARSGHRCRHNETYWAGLPYFAFGPGAARYVDGRRETNHRSTTTYLKRVLAGQSPTAESETLSDVDRSRELLVFGLRRLAGVDLDQIAAETGQDVGQQLETELRRFVDLGLLQRQGPRLRLTREGLFVSDAIWPHLLTG